MEALQDASAGFDSITDDDDPATCGEAIIYAIVYTANNALPFPEINLSEEYSLIYWANAIGWWAVDAFTTFCEGIIAASFEFDFNIIQEAGNAAEYATGRTLEALGDGILIGLGIIWFDSFLDYLIVCCTGGENLQSAPASATASAMASTAATATSTTAATNSAVAALTQSTAGSTVSVVHHGTMSL